MNRVLPSTGRSFLLIIGLFLSFSCFFGNITAQTYFILTDMEVIPATPDDQTPTSIHISGLRNNTCSFLGSSSLNVNASFTVLSMDWDNEADIDPAASCSNFFVPWDTTFQLGILNGGTNALYFSGNNYALSSVNNPTFIEVAPSDCNSVSTEITVSNTNDEGPGSLRQAIVCANANPGFNRIVFNLPGDGPDTIRVGETSGFELPSIFDDSTFIDGTTHPAFGNNGDFSPRVVLDGQFHAWDVAINALFVRADRCAIYGLEIINFPDDAIDVLNGDDVVIGGVNRGNVIHNNGLEQDFFDGNPGQGPWEGCGIVIRGGSARAKIQGNFIGTNYFETTPNGNEFCGILVRDGGDLHQIGGIVPGMSNVIVNNAAGIAIAAGTFGCQIVQNNLYCNDSIALFIANTSNNGILSPAITLAEYGNISGTAIPNQSIALYRNDNTTCTDAPCQGGTYLGTANVVNGSWTLSEPFANNTLLNTGDIITAIATDITGNSSEFADCFTYTGCSLTLTAANAAATTCGQNNGAVDLNTSGGTGPFIFSYNGQNTNNPNLENLSVGDYSVIVTDGNNCTAEVSFTIAENPATVLSVASQNDASCNNANGNFTISLAGGQAPFTFAINGTVTESLVFSNLTAGTYEVSVTDANNCSDVISVTLSDTNPPNLSVAQLTMATCGQDNGTADLTVSGGMLPFTFSYNGQNFDNPNLANLSPGNYTVTVSDVNNCTDEISFSILETSAPELSVLAQEDATCNDANGSFTLSVAGGQGPYLYTTNGATTGSPVFNNLFAGTYEVTVMDVNGCSDVVTVTLADSNPPIIAISQLNSATCGTDNGSLIVVAGGGTAPFVYSIDGAEQNNGSFNNLGTGIYTIGIRDANNCSTQLNAVIGDTPPVSLMAAEVIHPSCGNESGAFSITISGGTAPFEYTLNGNPVDQTSFNNLPMGSYLVVATDVEGCSQELMVNLEDTGLPEVSIIQQTDDSCNDGVAGFSLDVAGGAAPYEFDLGTGRVNTNEFNDLLAGTYQVTVTDANNCSNTVEVILGNNGTNPVSSFTFELTDSQLTAQSTAVGANGLMWNFGDGGSSIEETINHQYTESGIYMLCLTATNDCGSEEICEIIEIVLPLNDYSIGGQIHRTDGIDIGQVTVSCTNESDLLNNPSGDFLFTGLPQGENYQITPTKDINHRNGVTVIDIIRIRSHLLLIDTFSTASEYIAADVNRSGNVSVFDLLQMQEIVLEITNEFPQNTSWEFFPADYTFDYGSQALNYNYPQSITVNDLNTDYLNADFIGVKIGDTNDSNNPALTGSENSLWQIEDRAATAGEIINIPVRMLVEEKILGFEAMINFDPAHLELQQVTGVTGFQEEEGRLKFLWYTEEVGNQARKITPEMELMNFQFLVHTDLEKISEVINFVSPDGRQLLYNEQQTAQSIQWAFTDGVVTDIKSFDQRAPKLYPNPFNQQTLFTFELSGASAVSLEIYDLTGKAILRQDENFASGLQKMSVSGHHFPAAGTYFYRLNIDNQTFRGRIIKQ